MDELIKILGDTLEEKIGEEISTYDLLTLVYEEKITNKRLLYYAMDFDDLTIIQIHARILQEAKERGIKLVPTKKCDKIDMIHTIPYIIKHGRKNNARFDNKTPEIKEIEFYFGGWTSPYGPVIIRFDGDKVMHYILHRGCDKSSIDEDLVISSKTLDKSKREFLESLKNINIGLWAKEYSSIEEIMDGSQWELIITYNNGKTRNFSGSNDYPRNFDDLCRLVEHPDNEEE